MGKKKNKARELRRLAEEYLQHLAEESDIVLGEQEDLATSLVRQWLTYDGNATLFLGGEQLNLRLDRSPLGKLRILEEVAPPAGVRWLAEQWKIDPQELPDLYAQLNRGQSADVINDDGIPLRLWVNPRERSRGVESPDRPPKPTGWKPDYRKVAAYNLWRYSRELDPAELEQLTDSVVRQWQRYQGHACLFFQGARVTLSLTETADGSCVTTTKTASRLEAALASYDVPPDDIPDLIVKINLAQEIEFRNSKGILCRLWHDPRAGQLCCTASAPPQLGMPRGFPPLFCPNCGATLLVWEEGQQQQACLWCGQTVARG
jgi:hypothetical protein